MDLTVIDFFDVTAVGAAPEAAAEHPGRRLRVQPQTHPPAVAAGRTGMTMPRKLSNFFPQLFYFTVLI